MKIETEHGILCRVTVPFDCPRLYVRPGFGCKVVRGDQFTVTLPSGAIIGG